MTDAWDFDEDIGGTFAMDADEEQRRRAAREVEDEEG